MERFPPMAAITYIPAVGTSLCGTSQRVGIMSSFMTELLSKPFVQSSLLTDQRSFINPMIAHRYSWCRLTAQSSKRCFPAKTGLQCLQPFLQMEGGSQQHSSTQPKGNSAIALISVEDGSASTLKTFNTPVGSGGFSPDGRHLVYSVYSPSGVPDSLGRTFIIATDGATDLPLLQSIERNELPFWIRNGRSIVFTSDRGGSKGLWLIAVNHGRPQGAPQFIAPAPEENSSE